ncbi:hypothetical protein AAP_00927 [Ascosphaera apis ARSEF 7405]|uniref:Uncharacterized protein n=1 Tax=Ascosphaera apis ARSEF 7405 TaxID=392613 RepID=A0A168D257_9EURO|nr:hypothetical protein AAP_00927 [Ascosphaera apis ARSEF 7405]
MALPTLYPRLLEHFELVARSPGTTSLDTVLISCFAEQLNDSTDELVYITLIKSIAQLLPELQEDPTPLRGIVQHIADHITFAQIDAIGLAIAIVRGLQTDYAPINLLVLILLETAEADFENTEIVAENQDLVGALLELFLTTASGEVAEAASDSILALLQVNLKDGKPGRLWQRLFRDTAVYSKVITACGFASSNEDEGQHAEKAQTISQARLLDLVPKVVALNWEYATEPYCYSAAGEKLPGLLDFATNHMIVLSDPLLLAVYIDFARELIEKGSSDHLINGASRPLQFLVDSHVHQKIIQPYVSSSTEIPMDLQMLSGPITQYIARYVALYPNHFLTQSPQDVNGLLDKISQKVDIPMSRWANNPNNGEELNILANLPRLLLLKHPHTLLCIPSEHPTREILTTLACLFTTPAHGSSETSNSQQLFQSMTNPQIEAAAARVLYLRYIHKHPDFWKHVSSAIETVAVPEVAFPALNLLNAVLMANWEVETNPPHLSDKDKQVALPTDDDLRKEFSVPETTEFPSAGLWAILTPPALTSILPLLLESNRGYSLSGNAGTHTWDYITAKFDILKTLQSQLTAAGGRDRPLLKDIVTKIDRRVAQGKIGEKGSHLEPQIETVSS